MRSLKYAKGVVSGERNVSMEVVDSAKDYISIIERYNQGENIVSSGIATISEAIEYEKKYMPSEIEWNDALVFAIMYGLIKGSTLYYAPRKNGKSRFLYFIMRFIHLYRNDLKVGVYSRSKDMAHCTMSDFIHNMFLEGYKSSKSQKSVRVKGKNNEYILLSENSPTEVGDSVDILLVDEMFSLRDGAFNGIFIKKDIIATATSFSASSRNSLGFKDIEDGKIIRNIIKYSTPTKDFDEVMWNDIIKANPVLESEIFHKKANNVNTRFLKKQYERCLYVESAKEHFLAKHLNMANI